MGSSPEPLLPPGWEEFVPPSARSPTPPVAGKMHEIRGSVNLDKAMDGSQESSPAPVMEESRIQPNSLPGDLNAQKTNCNILVSTVTTGWESTRSQFNLSTHSHNQEKQRGSSPGTSSPPGWENTRPQPEPLSAPLRLEETGGSGSPEITRPPGWEALKPSTPPFQGVLNTEKSKGHLPEASTPPKWEKTSSQHAPSLATPAPCLPDVGQMVCGSCRQLLSYPRGTMHVKCPCCQIINYVLEEHQVGTVKCGKCSVLLMYPYGASSVRCSGCRFVTEVGAHNSRPSLSMRQVHCMPQNPVG